MKIRQSITCSFSTVLHKGLVFKTLNYPRRTEFKRSSLCGGRKPKEPGEKYSQQGENQHAKNGYHDGAHCSAC